MAGNKEGGRKAAATMKAKYGADVYAQFGKLGGTARNPNKGFGSNRELASEAGKKGGTISKRRKAGNAE